MRNKILLVEDESDLALIVSDTLREQGYDVLTAGNGITGLDRFKAEGADLIVADVMMPKMDGFKMAKEIRKLSPIVPVLFLTAKSTIDDIEEGFEIGANDYIRKPFQIAELVARIKVLLKHAGTSAEDSVIDIAGCRFDFAAQRLTTGDTDRELSHIEAIILDELFHHVNEVVEARTLMYRIWQNDDYNNLNRLHGFIYKIRKYLSTSPLDILNVRGIGYKLAKRN